MKKGMIIVAALLMSGCGTLNTVFRSDAYAGSELQHIKTYCDEIPRVYSGVAYNYCNLHADPAARPGKSGPLLSGVLIDGAISGVLDTLLLPYTGYRQVSDGNIVIPRSTWKPGANR